MSGYYNYSMSNNAVSAYESGEKPLSKWLKKDLLDEIIDYYVETDNQQNLLLLPYLAKVKVSTLKSKLLFNSSWHHTSNYYNKTEFYSLDTDKLDELTDTIVLNWIEQDKANRKNKKKDTGYPAKCKFLEWSGTRKHPKATEHIEIGIIRGESFYRNNGKRKSIYANGFKILERL
ncbi:hypothetical protein SAMN05421767_10428 [Granulicatella balaenopterae]|uniref:Uncharacterized protein n=1 Tax=Granulicatella balaenopterae TaxID=137733 RepID=A0A1H9I1R4_9LACT|nr:hypothetical protein [Granulicatella balaenopterae]SEQ68478.1 hypothetical protein SAMN05421767_10428 [Granulicatella balaenopterae]